MISLDSHPGIPRERLEQVGGKAAVLEALVRDAADIPIAEFVIAEDSNQFYQPPEADTHIVRGSSVLDFLGGFGVSDSLVNTKMVSDAIREVRESAQSVLGVELARRRGYEDVPPVIPIIQRQVDASIYGVMMRHPTDEDTFVVELSDSRSMYAHEQKMSSLFSQRELPPAVERFLSGRGSYGFSISSVNRDATVLRIFKSGDTTVFRDQSIMEKEYVKNSIEEALKMYERIDGLGIVDPETVSIMEFGILDDGTVSMFQYTPVMQKRESHETSVPEEYYPLGTRFIGSPTEQNGLTLPVINFPGVDQIEAYLRLGSGSDVERIPTLVEILNESRLKGFHTFLDTMPEEKEPLLKRLATIYIETELRNAGGGDYLLAMSSMDRLLQNLVFSIPTPTAVVIENDIPGILQHGMARLLYEVPHVFVGGNLPDGQQVNVRSNGLEAGAIAVE